MAYIIKSRIFEIQRFCLTYNFGSRTNLRMEPTYDWLHTKWHFFNKYKSFYFTYAIIPWIDMALTKNSLQYMKEVLGLFIWCPSLAHCIIGASKGWKIQGRNQLNFPVTLLMKRLATLHFWGSFGELNSNCTHFRKCATIWCWEMLGKRQYILMRGFFSIRV